MSAAAAGSEEAEPPAPSAAASGGKVRCHLRSIGGGGAPILTKNKFKIDGTSSISAVDAFLRKQLKLDSGQSLFIYVNDAFAPTPEQDLQQLYDCFAVGGELVLNYSITEAYG